MTISILLSLYHMLPHIVTPFLTFSVRSVCAFMRVCLCTHMSQGGIIFMLVLCFLKVECKWKTNPPAAKAGYGNAVSIQSCSHHNNL